MYRSHVLVCGVTCCTSSGSEQIIKTLEGELEKTGLQNEIKVIKTGCFGLCALGPIMIVYPEGAFYSMVTPADIPEIVSEPVSYTHLDVYKRQMVDIQGLEDFFGDMDFKVGGTEKGITAIQVDIKVDGLTIDIIREAFEKTRKARMHILNDVMLPVIPEPRAELSKYAPKMLSLKIDVDKIREVIGAGGKVIQKICAECDVKIDIEEDGSVFVSAIDIENARRAINVINTIVNDPEPGTLYKGKVTRIMTFGAFVEIAPGKEGLCHISKLEDHRVEKVEDVVNVGDEIVVMVTEIDPQGRINLSRRDALKKLSEMKQ